MNERVIAHQKSKISDEQAARVKARLNRQQYIDPFTGASCGREARDPNGSGKSPEDRARDAEVAAHKAGEPKAIPGALVAAAVRAADVLMPADLEERVVAIARMYLEKVRPADIAEALDVPIELVRSEIKKLDMARQVGFKEAPELANKVLETHFDVLAETVKGIEQDYMVLENIREELRMDFQDNMDYRNRTIAEVDTDDDNDGLDENNTPKKPKRKPSMSPMKIDSYFKGREVVGKQIDRVANLLGLLGKHMPESGGTTINQINVAVDKNRLNALADQFLSAGGHSITTVREAARPELRDVIDVQGEQL